MNAPHALLLLPALLLACSGDPEADVAIAPDAATEAAADVSADPGVVDTSADPCLDDADCVGRPGQGPNPCRTARCLIGAGICVFEDLAEGTACDPGDPCVVGATCRSGTCAGLARACDDSDPCTADSCAASAGGCLHAPAPGEPACDDDNPCTTADRCVDGACTGDNVPCSDDDNPCTTSACDPASGECRLSLLPGAGCDDLDPCTTDDVCGDGAVCAGVTVTCNDGNPCTLDACQPLTGACAFEPDDGRPCNDGNPCTAGDACLAGDCLGQGIDCDDDNPCTLDVCSADDAGGCHHVPANGVACDDGDPCTKNDHCQAGACVAGSTLEPCCDTAADCDDGDPCTFDECVDHACSATAVTCVVSDPCAWARCVEGTCQAGVLPQGGHLELLRIGFEADDVVPGLVLQGGAPTTNTVHGGARSLAVAQEGEVLRLDAVYLPAGTSALQGWVRSGACTGTGLLVAVDGQPHVLGCGPATRWSPFQVPLVAEVAGLHDVEILWWGGAPLWLDDVSIDLIARAGCEHGLVAERIEAPAGLRGADVLVDSERRPALAVARADAIEGGGVLLGRPGPTGWSFESVIPSVTLTAAAGEVVFEANALQGGGLVATWSIGQAPARVGFWPGGAPEAAVVIRVVTGTGVRLWPDLATLRDGRVLLGVTASEASGRFRPYGPTFNPDGTASGPIWKPAVQDALAPNRVAVTVLDTDQRVLVWTRDGQLRAAILNADDSVAVADFAAHVGAIPSVGRVRAAALPEGRFVVVWEQAGLGTDLAGSLVDAYGTVLVDGFPVAFDAAGEERGPDVLGLPDGRFLVAWEDQPLGGNARVVARVFEDYGEGGDETVIDPDGPEVRAPRLALLPPFFAEVAWLSGDDLRLRPWGFDCAEGSVRCHGGQEEVCVGSGYARLGGACEGPACAPGPCD